MVHACHGIHSALRKKDILPFGTIRLDLEGIMLSEKSDREGQILHGLTCVWNLKKKKKAKLIETESRKAVARG